ncbi:MAG TPA: hypothetical protein VLB09_06085, partial [Nitrospiria bacterium]|nr:hypothetical protein [Nitrospiria bacterium]
YRIPNKMNRYMALILIFSFALQAVCLSLPPQALSMLQDLSEDERQEAVLYGKRGIRTELPEFIKEWSVNNKLEGFAFITTEFLALAYAARQSALRMTEMNSYDIEDTLAKSSGKLVFRVTLFGDSPDFSRNYTAIVKTDTTTVPTTFWDTPSGDPYGDGESSPTYVSDSDFYFSSEEVDPEEKITLVILDDQEKEVSRFSFDLGSLR